MFFFLVDSLALEKHCSVLKSNQFLLLLSSLKMRDKKNLTNVLTSHSSYCTSQCSWTINSLHYQRHTHRQATINPFICSPDSPVQSVVITPSRSVSAEEEETQCPVHLLRLPQEPQLHDLQPGLRVRTHKCRNRDCS